MARHEVAVMMSVSFREGYNSLNVAIFSSLYLEWDILLLISYRTQEWCWETVALGKPLKLFFCIHTFPFPASPSSRSQGFEEQKEREMKGQRRAMFVSWQRHYKDSERFEKAVCSEWRSSLLGLFMYSWALTSIVRMFKSSRITMAGESQSVHELQARTRCVLKLCGPKSSQPKPSVKLINLPKAILNSPWFSPSHAAQYFQRAKPL